MRIAILSDIHGNIVALKAVLKEVREAGITRLFVLGDFVGYYYRPDEVLAELKGFDATMVRGNHETMLEVSAHDEEAKKKVTAKYGSGVALALKKLSQVQMKQLLALPETARVTVDGMSFFLCHGSPWDNDEYIYPDADEAVLKRCAEVGTDFVLMGHTHRPFLYAHNGTVVMNAGSVGQPRDIGNLASWAVIDTKNKSVVHRRTEFDVKPVAEEAKQLNPEVPYLVDVLHRKKL